MRSHTYDGLCFIERVSPRGLAAVGKPDLVPVNPEPSKGKLGFCRGDPSTLVLTVKNQGAAAAGPSHMTVTFGSGQSVSVNTPSLQAGASVDLPVAVPPQCFHPDCSFTIKVDSNSEVDESDENNNVADGYCLG